MIGISEHVLKKYNDVLVLMLNYKKLGIHNLSVFKSFDNFPKTECYHNQHSQRQRFVLFKFSNVSAQNAIEPNIKFTCRYFLLYIPANF